MTKTNLKELLKSTKRTLYVDDEVLATAPKGGDLKDLQFFKLDKWVTNEELEKEYQSRNLIPATIETLVAYDKEKLDKMKYVGTHWKDANGKWCYAAFDRWDVGGRAVFVDRSAYDWNDFWWFAGLANSPQKSDTRNSGALNLDLATRVEALEEQIKSIRKFLVF